jgi:hypothetical protein
MMKKYTVLFLVILMPLFLLGSARRNPPIRMKNGFYFTCPSLSITSMKNNAAYGLGISAGWIFNRSFSLGVGSNLFLTNIKPDPPDTNNYGLGYFGLTAEYLFTSKDWFHVALSTLVGGGIFGPWQSYTCYHDGYSSGRIITSAEADGFYLIEPRIDLLMDISWLVRIGAGVSYRFLSGIEKYGFCSADLNGFSLNLIFQLGLF